MSQLPASSCNRTIRIPALPAATSGQIGVYNEHARLCLYVALAVALMLVL
ncbi:hypothetical protein SLEP1_g26734 [Rubroshorea leprosula]|nr:hypothetical protein SLEP1_g26734 [Rubroshorea leprosula]